MAPKFGTSGLRGLVAELTPELVSAYVRAFLRTCPVGPGLFVAHDLRPSSPGIAEIVIATARAYGIDVANCGAVPTPALALAAKGAGAVMVTGSHIPADRNGLKFYMPSGEISKSDESAILAALETAPANWEAKAAGACRVDDSAGPTWVARYVDAFGPAALSGLRIGVWSHSAVSRDLLCATMAGLGAEVVEVGRSEDFIPVDTEAVPDWARRSIAGWVREFGLDALISTDGDGDRPLVADETGHVIPGDILGQITAAVLGAQTVVTPVSSNSGVELGGRFDRVLRTKIGSPFVIAGMQEAGGRVVGYEANGGFLLGFDARLPGGVLSALVTRDSLLPIVAPLTRAQAVSGLSVLMAQEPRRFTAADRLENVPSEQSAALIRGFDTDVAALGAFLGNLGEAPTSIDRTDGLRVRCVSGRIVHFRPSGNAPELRLYVEAEAVRVASDLLEQGIAELRARLG